MTRCPALDGGTVAYVDGSVAATGAMGAGIFYGIGHPLNRSVRLRQWWSDSGACSPMEQTGEAIGDPNLAELGAVYLALLFHPPDQPLTLCTDSLFVLQQMQWLTAQQVRTESPYRVSLTVVCPQTSWLSPRRRADTALAGCVHQVGCTPGLLGVFTPLQRLYTCEKQRWCFTRFRHTVLATATPQETLWQMR